MLGGAALARCLIWRNRAGSWVLEAYERWIRDLGIVGSDIVDVALTERAVAGVSMLRVRRLKIGCMGL